MPQIVKPNMRYSWQSNGFHEPHFGIEKPLADFAGTRKYIFTFPLPAKIG